MEDRLRTLLSLLGRPEDGGWRPEEAGRRSEDKGEIREDHIEDIGSSNDTLQYLSQLERVARKLKDQLIRQKQESSSSDHLPSKRQAIKPKNEESEC